MCSPSQPSTPEKTTQVAELPEWAKPYAKDTLAKGAALTDINKNPYQTYGGERIAGFTPLQQQSQQAAASMQPSQQLGLGSNLAGAAGLGALGTNYQAGNFYGGQFNSDAAKQYMNPYMQNVVDIQQREAQRQADIAGTQRNAQAVGAGAFGGSRQAIMDAEAARNLATQKGDIQAQGLNAAYGQAANQFNQDYGRNLQAQQMGEQSRQYGAGLGMQGLQTALQSAGQLGQLGQTQYGQEMGINQLQNQYGAQQQQQQQRGLDVGYQDFLNQQNYPYKQLGFMSDMVRGLPLGQQSTSSVYQGSGPGMVQTLAGLGGAAYGFGKSGLFADGGEVKTYAGDKGSVTSQDNKDSIVEGMYSIAGLQKAKEAALNRRDLDTAQAIDERIAELNALQGQQASIDYGLGSAFNQIPQDQQEQMMAGGGMVAFAPGGTAKSKDTYGNKFEQSLTDLKSMANETPAEPTPEQREEAISARIPILEKRYGPDVTQPYLEETKTKRAGLADQMEKDKGLALAMASLKLLSPSKNVRGRSEKEQLLSGLGEAGESFVGEVNRLKKEHRDVDDKLRQSEILLATAQQSRKEGLINKADAEETRAQDLKRDVFKTKLGLQEKVAQLQSGLAQTEMQGENALKVAGVHGEYSLKAAKVAAAHPTDLDKQAEAIYAAKVAKDPSIASDPQRSAQTRADARQTAAAEIGRYPGDLKANLAQRTLDEKVREKAETSVDNMLTIGNSAMRAQYRQMQADDKKNKTNTAADFREGLIQDHIKRVGQGGAPDSDKQQPPPINTGMPSRGGPQPTSQLSPMDQQALEWARSNPKDPRAAAIKQRLGMGG
jgi:hypothetical protein